MLSVLRKSGIMKTFALCFFAVLNFCSCTVNEVLPPLNTEQGFSCEFVRVPGRTRGIDRMLNDDPDDSTVLIFVYPEIDFTEIKTLPVYEKTDCQIISEDDIEEYISEVNKIGELIGARFERFIYGDEYKDFDEDYDKKWLSFYVGSERYSPDCRGIFEIDSFGWCFLVDESSTELVFADCIERDLDKFDNRLLKDVDNQAYIEAVHMLDEIMSQPFSEDTREYLSEFFGSLENIAPSLFKDKYSYVNCGQGLGVRYSGRNDCIWFSSSSADLSLEKSKLLDYNGFIDKYSVYFYDDEYGNRDYVSAIFGHNDNRLMGEYRIISPEEAAKTLELGENEKLAILYIEQDYEDKTILRPVYAKYTYQRDLFGGPERYIDAIF